MSIELEVYEKVAVVLSHSPHILTELQSYKGAAENIKKVVKFCIYMILNST